MSEALLKDRAGHNSGANSAGSDKVMKTGTATFTGSDTDIDTGLTLIEEVVVSVKDANQGAGDAAYCTYNHGADGLLDLYAWDDGGLAASVACTVTWMAIGTI